jgi:short-subunit dehydrogenase
VNATAPLKITHHFLNQMLDNKQRGAVFFTSSPAGLMPCPMSSIYGSTKAFLTEFATSIAPEVKSDGIDICVVNPSPVDTGFYAGNKHNLGAMNFFQKTATSPQTIAKCFFRSVGRTVVHEQGYFPFALRMLLKILDVNFLSIIIQHTAHTQADFQRVKKKRSFKAQ